mmetsp:Transcript_36113/g.103869  ORF Transcript_36113/g.103869 Transcript_36113/m.103869 type:complete len:206 (-) Transcript_36113:527-1144(-)
MMSGCTRTPNFSAEKVLINGMVVRTSVSMAMYAENSDFLAPREPLNENLINNWHTRQIRYNTPATSIKAMKLAIAKNLRRASHSAANVRNRPSSPATSKLVELLMCPTSMPLIAPEKSKLSAWRVTSSALRTACIQAAAKIDLFKLNSKAMLAMHCPTKSKAHNGLVGYQSFCTLSNPPILSKETCGKKSSAQMPDSYSTAHILS